MYPHKEDNHSKIITVLERLEKQSRLERLEKADIKNEELMLAITEETGKFLNILLIAMNAGKVLEIGTSTGYSTLWFAFALSQMENIKTQKVEKSIITIDNDLLKIKRAKNNFIDAGVQDMIKIIEGDALNILFQLSNNLKITSPGNNNLFDFIFLDGDKENLTKYFDLSLPLLKKGGIIVTDNILFPEAYRSTMSQYVKYIKSNESVMSLTVPIGYGEEITIKTK
ncbi:MAG: O-methyltransferase [Nitrosopumilus sp.]|jgi:predicted O-methyltransferase YrrM|nr:O-methyltransferase [Nitrosopumilus sp.]